MPAEPYPRGGPAPYPMHGGMHVPAPAPAPAPYAPYPPPQPHPAMGDPNRGEYRPKPGVVDATGPSTDTARHAK